jgi:hypothetical protein
MDDIRLILHPCGASRPIEAVSVELLNASMVAQIPAPPLFNVASMKADRFSLAVVHTKITSSPDVSLRDLGGSLLQIGNLSYSKSHIRNGNDVWIFVSQKRRK